MLRFRSSKLPTKQSQESKSVAQSRGSKRNLGLRKRKLRSPRRTTISPHVFVVVVLIVVTIVEAVYLFYLGGYGETGLAVWDAIFGTLVTRRVIDIKTPIDDYNSRTHIKNPVPLIVGGSDGSGTRAFAYVLEQLDVPMVVDDRGTMDVHAKEMFNGQGWPPLVSKLLDATHSATYNVEDLPASLQTLAFEELGKLLQELQRRGISRYNAAARPMSSAVSWGFKAPVSMLLLPLFRKHFPAIKLIHIVRDGRDVALSENHSPVEKFYDAYFKDSTDRTNALRQEEFSENTIQIIKAMELWNDWNRKVYKYSTSQADGQSFDVLVMRAEDLIQNPYESILRLADFVGSPKTPREICCLSQRGANDLGGSSVGLRGRGGTSFGPDEFENMKRRFQEFAPNDHQTASGEGKNPILSWGDIRERMVAVESAGDATNKDPSVSNNTRRRLAEVVAEVHNDDEVELELPKEMPRSAIDIKMLSQYSAGNSDVGEASFDQIRRMQKSLDDRRAMVDLTEGSGRTTVKERYGKWVKILESTPRLSDKLHLEGKESLDLFGYEPSRVFMDVQGSENFKCDRTVICEDPNGMGVI
jgi:hypothetical protein